jgi:hypothetical protein
VHGLTKDIAGQQFGTFTALRCAGRDANGNVFWDCLCEHGKVVLVRSDRLRSGKTSTCSERTHLAVNRIRARLVPVKEYVEVCSVYGCEQQVKAQGWCGMHYARWRRHGDPMLGGRKPAVVTAMVPCEVCEELFRRIRHGRSGKLQRTCGRECGVILRFGLPEEERSGRTRTLSFVPWASCTRCHGVFQARNGRQLCPSCPVDYYVPVERVTKTCDDCGD